MTPSTLTGDRRWASARRGGMTVLGKVAVPKPINLPSQRLENHGLDPNVEIVPKGTLSWGSRPSSAGSNAWGTSALSPSTDGGSSSPSRLVGRPSSGGGTRPSTAGSEKAHDSNVGAWGSNSRPSSASGGLASNHASSTSSRPRSAETRPGSSHLSRFAEPSPEGSGVWGATSAPERMGVASSAKEGFSLSTGDFPTLGSEKDESKRNLDPLDHPSHGRPGSSSGVRTMADSRGFTHADDVSRNSDIRGDSWKKDGPPFVEDGPRPSMERWHGEPHLYPNPSMAPPHYESWRGAPPVNPPGGVWFRGPPGPPYGGPVPPGGFPMDQFPFYHPQVPAPGLASSQQIPPGAGHHGHHPKNGDFPRMPHVPHMHPGMPMRPGFYPGPVPYDGYYRPPLGFCNPNDRDLPFMGMPAGPPVYGRHPNQNAPDLNNTHPRSLEGRGPEHVQPGHPHDLRGPYKVLMNPNDGWNPNEEEKWGHRMTTNAVNREKGILAKAPLQESTWGDDYKKDEDIQYGNNANIEASSLSSDNKFASINPSSLKFPEGLTNIDEAQMSPAMENVTYPQDDSLIQKIGGLNAKARAAGGTQEGFRMEELNDRVQINNAKDHQPANGANSDVIFERHYPTGVLVPIPRKSDAPQVDKGQEPANASVTAGPRRSVRGTQSRGDPHVKDRFQGQEVDGWGKRFDSHPVLESGSRSMTNDQVEDHNGTIMSNVDPSDMQRAKMREIAKQRAIQLQKEGEERVREQKAKALAKLEELNRRSTNQSVESSSQKETIQLPGDAPKKREFSRNQLEPSVEDSHNTESSSALFNYTAQVDERNTSKTVDSDVSSRHISAETLRNTHQEDAISLQNQLLTDANVDEDSNHKNAHQVREVSRQKRGYKQRQNFPPEKNIIQDAIPSGRADVLKDVKVTSSTQEASGNIVGPGVAKEEAGSPVSAELPVQKKEVNKSGKNRRKVEESSSVGSSLPKDLVVQATSEAAVQNVPNLPVNFIPDPKDATQSLEIHASQHYDDTHGRNNAWKPQHSRKPRNTQGNRSSNKNHSNDAAFWAPVRANNKLEVIDQMSQKSAEPLVSSATGDNLVPNSSKTKRAEMERYVPKPVAKELAQQGSIHHPSSPSIDPSTTDGSGKEKASQGLENVMKAGDNMESKHVEGKNRHQRAQGSWRQRVSTESIAVHSSQDSSGANNSKNTHTSNASQSNARSDGSLVRGPPSRPDEHSEKEPQVSITDGWGDIVSDSSCNTSATFTVVKDHVPSGRGKRHLSKGQKSGGSYHQNLDHKDSKAGLADLQSSHVEAIQSEKISSKESRAGGDRSASHWQPKSQGYVAYNQQGNRSRGSQNIVTEESMALKRESGPHSAAKDPILVSEDKGPGQGKPSLSHHEAKRDRRVAPVKGRPHSPSQEPETLAGQVEPAAFGTLDGRSEQRPSSGYRKNANYNGRSNRGHEPRGDWSSTALENKQLYTSANRERQRQNSHYEYQPVGPYNGSGRSNEPVFQTENQSGASKFRERGQGHSRRGRGTSYGRQSGQ